MTMTNPSDAPKSRISQADVFVRQANVVLSVIESMKLPGPLPEAERLQLRRLAARVTPAFLEAVAAASEASGGNVAGVAFDPDQARETIAYLAASDVLITALESVLVALADERLRRKTQLANPALAIYATLGRQQRVPEGRSFLGHLRTMRAALPRARKKSRKQAEPAVTPSRDPEGGNGEPVLVGFAMQGSSA